MHFVCVGTPQRTDSGRADLSQLDSCIAALGPLLEFPCLVVGKSTVPVGAAAAIADHLARLAPIGDAAELPGIQNSCARAVQWKTLCDRTESW